MFKAINGKKIITFIICVAIPLAVGWLSTLVTGDIEGVYTSMQQPSFAPPPIVFPIVWSILYTLMGISLYLVVKDGLDKPGVRDAIFYFAVSLVLNFFWTPVFFKWGLILFALVWLVFMIIFAIITAYKFYNINKLAGILWIPYILWLLFALALNIAYYNLNGAVL
ncbi:MAG: tryptophan-rich sensory protein [Clostridia bacterium]|nr:tryptophan-rich sensory protein [Clostridia bacterium]